MCIYEYVHNLRSLRGHASKYMLIFFFSGGRVKYQSLKYSWNSSKWRKTLALSSYILKTTCLKWKVGKFSISPYIYIKAKSCKNTRSLSVSGPRLAYKVKCMIDSCVGERERERESTCMFKSSRFKRYKIYSDD